MNFFDSLYTNELRISIANFLGSEMVFGFDWWILVHLISGVLFMYLIFNYKLERKFNLNKWTILLIGLIAFEFIELYFFLSNSRWFIPETTFNQVLDVFVGFIGALLFKWTK